MGSSPGSSAFFTKPGQQMVFCPYRESNEHFEGVVCHCRERTVLELPGSSKVTRMP